MKLPFANNKDIVIQDLGKELLVYNLITHKACGLNETSKIIFNACNSATTFEDLKRQYKFTDDLIYLTLDELNKHNLIAESYQSKFAGVSRREVIMRVGLTTMIALPVITGLVAPTAVQAASAGIACTRQSCTSASSCTSPCNVCSGSGACSVDGSSCNNLGGNCAGTISGTCQNGFCTAGLAPCSNPGGSCGALRFGTCNGTGTCG